MFMEMVESVKRSYYDVMYLEAARRGDIATCERMLLDAAKRAMPNTKVVGRDGYPLVVYHGTNWRNVFTITTPRKMPRFAERTVVFSTAYESA